MKIKKIILLKFYKEILLECKKINMYNEFNKIEEKNYSNPEKAKQKVLTLFK